MLDIIIGIVKVGEMPIPKRVRSRRTDEWTSIQQWTFWPERDLYEQLKLILLFSETTSLDKKASVRYVLQEIRKSFQSFCFSS